MRASRAVRRSCPVNINLSAQWSYHEGTRKKFRRNRWRLHCHTSSFAQQRPPVQRGIAAVAASAAAVTAAAPRGTNESAVLTLKKEEQRHNLESSCEMSIRPRQGRPEKRDFTYSLNVERSPRFRWTPRGTFVCVSIRIIDAKSSTRLLTRIRVIRETQEPGTITMCGHVSKVTRLHGTITISSITMLLSLNAAVNE